MATIDELIQREVNPFDPVTFHTGDFWRQQQNLDLTVNSIHQKEIAEITQLLEQVNRDRQTRSILLLGDRGSGKSYLLSRLKKQLNSKAFFAYIGPWAENDLIWRHILRYTVDSLMQVPDGQDEPQLLLWLKSLSAFGDRSLKKKILGERGLFIHNLRGTYPSGIYQAKEFFGVLYDLTNPELYYTACDWLRGDDLDEESLKQIRVRRSIETETDAKNILANFGKISANTQPIVICLDQVDSSEKIKTYEAVSTLFTINTTIHNEQLKNFLIIISLINENWKNYHNKVFQADKDRIYKGITLKYITCEQAKAIWEKRLYPLHQKASIQPEDSIYPLKQQDLEAKFPGGKTFPRYALQLARKLYQNHKLNIAPIVPPLPDPYSYIDAFRLLWEHKLKKNQEIISRIRYFSNPELIQMLRQALEALEVPEIQSRLLQSQKYDSSSISCQLPNVTGKAGFVWTEDKSLRNFFYLMNACKKTINHNLCQKLYLIRAAGLGNANNKGYKLYQQIFSNSSEHCHVIPSLESVQYLATYHNLVNAAAAGELVVGDREPNIAELQSLIRQTKIFHDCSLLKNLDILPGKKETKSEHSGKKAKQFMLSLIKNQQMLGRDTLMDNTLNFDMRLEPETINKLIQELRQEKKIQILGPEDNPAAQFICLVPKP